MCQLRTPAPGGARAESPSRGKHAQARRSRSQGAELVCTDFGILSGPALRRHVLLKQATRRILLEAEGESTAAGSDVPAVPPAPTHAPISRRTLVIDLDLLCSPAALDGSTQAVDVKPWAHGFLEAVRHTFRLALWSQRGGPWVESALTALDPNRVLLPVGPRAPPKAEQQPCEPCAYASASSGVGHNDPKPASAASALPPSPPQQLPQDQQQQQQQAASAIVVDDGAAVTPTDVIIITRAPRHVFGALGNNVIEVCDAAAAGSTPAHDSWRACGAANPTAGDVLIHVARTLSLRMAVEALTQRSFCFGASASASGGWPQVGLGAERLPVAAELRRLNMLQVFCPPPPPPAWPQAPASAPSSAPSPSDSASGTSAAPPAAAAGAAACGGGNLTSKGGRESQDGALPAQPARMPRGAAAAATKAAGQPLMPRRWPIDSASDWEGLASEVAARAKELAEAGAADLDEARVGVVSAACVGKSPATAALPSVGFSRASRCGVLERAECVHLDALVPPPQPRLPPVRSCGKLQSAVAEAAARAAEMGAERAGAEPSYTAPMRSAAASPASAAAAAVGAGAVDPTGSSKGSGKSSKSGGSSSSSSKGKSAGGEGALHAALSSVKAAVMRRVIAAKELAHGGQRA